MYKNINSKSTPLSCNQKKSSINKSSISSSSLTIGTIIGSGIKLNDSIMPLSSWDAIVRNIKKPNKENMSWKLTDKIAKYWKIFLIEKLKYCPLFHSIEYCLFL